jgi:hypothetical protein
VTASKLSSAIAAEQSRRSSKCGVGVALKTLPPAEATELIAALADEVVQHTALSRALRVVDLTIHPDTIARHRRGDCGCHR